ncbi:MAG TPA: protein-L-isoaspartate(D-aspartate) O-methyltransferase [Gaiellaceae bacterium]|nr:protein-L-isoaspartate(D-aspartate) O-methyltransferase [Gaiellaceae bacterium]
MARVDRARFVPDELRPHAWEDVALPIGHGQTISQPTMVRLICEALDLRGPEKVLDVGTGSGYQAAVLAELAAEVHSIERIPELAGQARAALAGTGVHVHVGDGTRGLPAEAPFDAIAVAAAAAEPPAALLAQLAPGGRLVLPVGPAGGQRLRTYRPDGSFVEGVACRFVPLVEVR